MSLESLRSEIGREYRRRYKQKLFFQMPEGVNSDKILKNGSSKKSSMAKVVALIFLSN